jgi:hypothetical protein
MAYGLVASTGLVATTGVASAFTGGVRGAPLTPVRFMGAPNTGEGAVLFGDCIIRFLTFCTLALGAAWCTTVKTVELSLICSGFNRYFSIEEVGLIGILV